MEIVQGSWILIPVIVNDLADTGNVQLMFSREDRRRHLTLALADLTAIALPLEDVLQQLGETKELREQVKRLKEEIAAGKAVVDIEPLPQPDVVPQPPSPEQAAAQAQADQVVEDVRRDKAVDDMEASEKAKEAKGPLSRGGHR